MKLSESLDGIGKPISYYPRLAKFLGSVKASVFFCQLYYWRGKESDPDGWLFKTSEEWTDETGLSYKEQLSARAQIKALGILEEQYDRLSHRMYYRINKDTLDALWQRRPESPPDIPKGKFPIFPKGSSGTPQWEDGGPPNGGSVNKNTETTTEITAMPATFVGATTASSPSQTPDLPPPPQSIELEDKKQASVKCPYCGEYQEVNLHRPACISCKAEFEYRIDGVSLRRFLPRTPGALLLRAQTLAQPNFRVRWAEFASEAERALWEETETQFGLEALRGWIDWAITKAIPKKRLVQAVTSALRQHGAVRKANEQAAPEQVDREREATKATDRMLDAYSRT